MLVQYDELFDKKVEASIPAISKIAPSLTQRGAEQIARTVLLIAQKIEAENKVNTTWVDKPLPEDEEIKAVHPMITKKHSLYQDAVRLVSARHSKYELVNLVNWLLFKLENK